MDIQQILSLTESFYKGEKPSVSQIEKLRNSIKGYNISLDYLDFISLFDGAEGAIGSEGYLAIWNLDDVIEVNMQYEDDPVFGKYFIFGSSGGTFHYAYKKEEGHIYELDLYEDSYNRFLGNTFTEFIENISI